MILQALNSYYERLAADPESDVVEFGYSRQKISFRVNVNLDGTLQSIQDARREAGKNLVPTSMIVLGGAKPPGAGINPCFLWDNTGYMLGWKPDDPKPDRTLETFEAFRERHLELREQIEDEEFTAVCEFLKSWDPARAVEEETLEEVGGGFGVFRVAGRTHEVHQTPAVDTWWRSQIAAAESGTEMQCLVTGRVAPIARIHEPKIKGVSGAQSAGATLVSYNFDATESYDKTQSYNGPVSQSAAFQYAVALNRLLDRDVGRRIQVGDAATVFWTEKPTPAEQLFGVVFESTEDENLTKQLNAILKKLAAGGYADEFGERETPFYILGLSPNAARLSVRFWRQSTLGEVVQNIGLHFHDLQIAMPPKVPEYPFAWMLLRQTARESRDIPPLLSGGLMRAILEGLPYPQAFFSALIRRIRADQSVPYLRASGIKACLNRDYRSNPDASPLAEELPVSLDPNRTEHAYHMGRLFAALEKAQEDALGKEINATIKDRYFGAASATPASVFPRLIRLHQHHVNKLDNPAHKTVHEKRIQEICGRIDDFPSHLTLGDQGLFAIGYYHQRQDFFTRKPKPESSDAETPE